MTKSKEFNVGEQVVYPPHGVGSITEKVTQSIGGVNIEVFVISFTREKMTLSVPVKRAEPAGLRHLSSNSRVKKALIVLNGKAKPNKKMWNRRAQEYDTKLNSGDMSKVAEIVRDLHPNVGIAERSYSERVIYENAFTLVAEEMAAIRKINLKDANEILLEELTAKEEMS